MKLWKTSSQPYDLFATEEDAGRMAAALGGDVYSLPVHGPERMILPGQHAFLAWTIRSREDGVDGDTHDFLGAYSSRSAAQAAVLAPARGHMAAAGDMFDPQRWRWAHEWDSPGQDSWWLYRAGGSVRPCSITQPHACWPSYSDSYGRVLPVAVTTARRTRL